MAIRYHRGRQRKTARPKTANAAPTIRGRKYTAIPIMTPYCGQQQRVSARMIGILVKAIRPDDAATQADTGGGHQQPADEEN
jgi:hypothetical protein